MDEQVVIKWLWEVSITSDMQMTPLLWYNWRGTEEPLDEHERREWKNWLETQHSNNRASGPITSWLTDRDTVETVTDFLFLGSKISTDGDCSHEIKWCLLLGRKAITNLDSILKIRDITLPTKDIYSKLWFFQKSCEMWELHCEESWAWKSWCFWTVVLEKTLESPLDCKEVKPVNPKGN